MSLRNRILIAVVATTIGLVVLLNLATRLILLRSFAGLEDEHAYEEAQHALAGLDNKLAALDTILVDWAAWDDTYTFIQDGNQEYLDSNLVDGTFINTGLDVMLYYNPQGQLVYGKAFDRELEQEVPIPAGLGNHLEQGDLLISHPDAESAINGIVMLPEGPMIVVSRPILHSDGSGPVGGIMIMGTYLNEVALQDLIQVTRLALDLYSLNDPELLSDGEIAALSTGGGESILVKAQDKQTIVAYALVPDIYGQPAIVMSVEMDRPIFRQGQMTLLYMSAALVAVGLVSGAVVAFILEHTLLFRLSQLGRDMNRVGLSGDATGRVGVVGNDELTTLARAVNTMLSSLEQYQRRLRDSEKQYRLLFEESPLTIEIYGLDGVLLHVNPAWEQVWGLSGNDMVGRYNILQDEQLARLGVRSLVERAFAGEAVSLPDLEFDSVQSGFPGRKRWVSSQIYHLRDEDGGLKNMVLLHEDITERRQARMALEESEARFRQLAETIREVFWVGTPDWQQVLYISPAYEEIWGRSCQSILDWPFSWFESIVEEDQAQVAEFISAVISILASNPPSPTTFSPALEPDTPDEFAFPEYRIIRADGSVRWILARAFVVRDEQGRASRIVGIAEDITARKLAEQKLQESELLYRTLFENVPVGIELATQDGQVLTLNDAMQRITGYSVVDMAYVRPDDMYQRPEERQEIMDRVLRDGMVRDVRVGMKRPDGTSYGASLTITPLSLGEQCILVTVVEDLTERNRAEAAERELTANLERARRMESLGTLAGGVAHDLNNILGPLVGYPELILLDLPADSPIRADVLQIQQSAERAATMVQDLLTLARRGAYQLTPLNLNAVIEEYLASPSFADLRARYPTAIVRVELEPRLMNVMGSVPHLSKVIMNLVANAMEAMPYGGELTIRTANQSLDQALVGYEYVDPGDYVVLQVMDTGVGIQAGDLGRIFEPFYTKKEMGRSGSGLGLSVVHGVVHDLKGKIDVYSEVGIETRFILYLPVTRGEIVPLEQDREIYGGTETVLVIDDLLSQRALAVRMLSSLGYRVEAVGDSRAALDYVRAHTVDVLVLDMILEEDTDGLDIYRRIIEYCPRQKAVIVSGFSETERVKELQRLGAGPFVKKPYTLADIGKAVRQELDHQHKD